MWCFCAERKYSVKTEVVQVDFKHEDVYSKIGGHLENKDISVLINNVGVMTHGPMPYEKVSWDDIQVK